MKLLALDFDGVISDSAAEAFVVALRTYAEMRPETRLLRGREPLLESGGAPPLAAVRGDPLYPPFLELMPLGNRAEDYAVSLAALEEGRELRNQADYDPFRTRQDEVWLGSYHDRFYEIRWALAEADPEGWYGLMEPYPAFRELLRRRAGDAMLAIATAKDRASVSALLRSYEMDDLFPPERVLDKETGVTKVAHLEHLQRLSGAPYPEITFVDDKVNHLDRAAPLGVRCALASWGYNGRREIEEARARDYLVCTLEEAESQLFG